MREVIFAAPKESGVSNYFVHYTETRFRILFFGDHGLDFTEVTSWAGHEALSGTISQYHAQFLEFGPDIVTRDLKQAQQHIESRMQKNKKYISSYLSLIHI